jgi:hypothetical protein
VLRDKSAILEFAGFTGRMKAHQRIIRESNAASNGSDELFVVHKQSTIFKLRESVVRRVSYVTARPIIEQHEWLRNMPLPKSVRAIFGIFFEGNLGGVVVYVEPSTRQFNERYPRKVLQLNRGACLWWTPTGAASRLIGASLRELAKEGIICVQAYCTPEAGEYGTIYQACNFWYVGNTAPSKM